MKPVREAKARSRAVALLKKKKKIIYPEVQTSEASKQRNN
jgi:hypothetical protein